MDKGPPGSSISDYAYATYFNAVTKYLLRCFKTEKRQTQLPLRKKTSRYATQIHLWKRLSQTRLATYSLSWQVSSTLAQKWLLAKASCGFIRFSSLYFQCPRINRLLIKHLALIVYQSPEGYKFSHLPKNLIRLFKDSMRIFQNRLNCLSNCCLVNVHMHDNFSV